MVNLKIKNNIFFVIAIIATIPALISKYYFPAVDTIAIGSGSLWGR